MKLGEIYTDFSRIDLDTRGGYARVAQVRTLEHMDLPPYCAFKLMRHEVSSTQRMERFADELTILAEIMQRGDAPEAITRLHDSGFVAVDLSKSLSERNIPDPELPIFSAGTDPRTFHALRTELWERASEHWLPYLVVELAPFDDSLLRQVRQQPAVDEDGLFRLPTGEVLIMALQLLDVMDYFYSKHKRVYLDWKPEHVFWNGLRRKVRLIDWNVTMPVQDDPGEKQNIQDDLRLFCGAVLYVGLTFVDPETPTLPIGSHPTREAMLPIPEIRRRYLTDNPTFYQRGGLMDEEIKHIIARGLNPNEGYRSTNELREVLIKYMCSELGVKWSDQDFLKSINESPYFVALSEIRLAQEKFLIAQQHLINATEVQGERQEFTRLSKVLKNTLVNMPISDNEMF